MRCFLRSLAFAVAFMSLAALAQDPTSAPAQADNASKATVHIYRYKQFVGSALSPSVYCDGVQLARMENGRYFSVKVDPGKHTFTSNDKQSGIDLDLKAREEYYIRVELAAGFAKGHGRLILMSKEQGGYELKSDKLKPLDPDKIADKNSVPAEQPHLQPTALEKK